MTPLLMEKVAMIGIDIASDVLMDFYLSKKGAGVKTISVDEILTEAQKWKALNESEMKKVKDRLDAR
jgi:hypothetical protein